MTRRGVLRQRYADLMRGIDPRPSRFRQPLEHREWCARADAWAEFSGAEA